MAAPAEEAPIFSVAVFLRGVDIILLLIPELPRVVIEREVAVVVAARGR